MKRSTRIVRDIGALLSTITLLGMIVGAFLVPELHISHRAYATLLALISAFLGIDIARERWRILADMTYELVRTYLVSKLEDNNDGN